MLTYKVVLATFPGREKYMEESVESLRAQGVEPVIVGDTRWGPDKWNEALDNCETDLNFTIVSMFTTPRTSRRW